MTYVKNSVEVRSGAVAKLSLLAIAAAFCLSVMTPTDAFGAFPADPKESTVGTGGAPDEFSTGSMSGDQLVTQLDFIKWFVSLSGDTPLFDELSSVGDYVFWAHRMKMKPKAGWDPNESLTQEMFRELLVDVFNIKVKGNEDAQEVLDREGIFLPDKEDGDVLTWEDVVSVVDDDGFQRRLSVFASGACSPVQGDKYKTSNNKCTPPPPPVSQTSNRKWRGFKDNKNK